MSPAGQRAASPPGHELNNHYSSSSQQRATTMASERDRIEPNGARDSIAASSAIRSATTPSSTYHMDAVDTHTSLGSSSDQRMKTNLFNHNRRDQLFQMPGLHGSALTTDTLVYAPGAGNILASSTAWRTTAELPSGANSPVTGLSDDEATIEAGPSLPGSPTFNTHEPHSVANTPRKRLKDPTAAPHKRTKGLHGESHEHTQDVQENGDEDQQGQGEQGMDEQTKTEKKEEQMVDEKLPYRSYKTINMPERSNPDSAPVRNDPSTWYGTMGYEDSMITFWCDEREYSYSKTAELFTENIRKFSWEMTRKRHAIALLHQLEKYGKKDDADIPEAPAHIMRRGKKRALKKMPANTNANNNQARNGSVVAPAASDTGVQYTAGSTQSVRDDAFPIYMREAPFRQLEMMAIVVCKDLFNMEFPQIRDLMNKAYNFPMSLEKIASYYHLTRPLTYGSKHHGHPSIEDVLEQNDLLENKRVEAASKALVAFSEGQVSGAQQRPAVKVSQINKDGGVQVVVKSVAPGEHGGAETQLQLGKKSVDSDNTTGKGAESKGKGAEGDNVTVPATNGEGAEYHTVVDSEHDQGENIP